MSGDSLFPGNHRRAFSVWILMRGQRIDAECFIKTKEKLSKHEGSVKTKSVLSEHEIFAARKRVSQPWH